MNSAEGGTLFFCFLFHNLKATTIQTMRSKAAPVTPTAIATTFNDLAGFVTNGPTDVSVEGLALAVEGGNEREESIRRGYVGDCFGGGDVPGLCPIPVLQFVDVKSPGVTLVHVVMVGNWEEVVLEPPAMNDEGCGLKRIAGRERASMVVTESDFRFLTFSLTQSVQVSLGG